MIRKLLTLFLLCTLSISAETLNYYAIGKISSPAVSAKIRERFKADGEPLFLMHNSKRGVEVGDFLRFNDKIVLIDGQVWQTLAAEKVFSSMEKIGVTTLNGTNSSNEWKKKAGIVKTDFSKKSYLLGSEILKIFEEQFSSAPRNESIILTFSGDRVTLVVPDRMIQLLKLQRVTRSVTTGKMIWITDSCENVYANVPYGWQVWAADPGEPSGSIGYSLSGNLPKGIRWNKSTHTLEGTAEEQGVFPVVISARSSEQSISMSCTLHVTENSNPVWANIPDTLEVGVKGKRFPLLLSDKETPARNLSLTISTLPPGFEYHDSLQILLWNPADSTVKAEGVVGLSVSDPMGGENSYEVPVYYAPDGADVGYTFATLTPPWDTLVEGVTYSWNIENERVHWRKNHLQMKLGECSDSTAFEDPNIVMRPQRGDTAFTVVFRFRDREKMVTHYDLVLPVKKNRAPYFTSLPEKWDIELRDLVYFEPKAEDPENESVEIRLRSADSGFVYRDNRLSFEAHSPGTYQAYLEAEDSFGNITVQQITYYVKKVYDTYRGFSLETGIWPGSNTWRGDSWGFMNPYRFHWDTRALRFGFFIPDDCNLRDTLPFRFPFVYVGTDFVPPNKRAEGRSAAADLGFSYNVFNRKIHTFGMYFNFEATAVVERLFQSQTEFRLMFFGRHLLRKVSVNHTINDDGSLTYENVKELTLLEEFISTNNINLFIGGTQWFHLGSAFFVGPTMQLRIAPVAMTMEETYPDGYIKKNLPEDLDSLEVIMDQSKNIYSMMAGIGFRNDLKIGLFQFENQVRVGYGGREYGAMVYWDTRLAMGRFRR